MNDFEPDFPLEFMIAAVVTLILLALVLLPR